MPRARYTPDSILLTDRVAIVTGAARGIGRDTALLFARFGASLALCDRDRDGLTSVVEEVGTLAGTVTGQHMDVRDHQSVAQFLSDLQSRFRRVDILVNNAGGTYFAPFVDVTDRGESALVRENFLQVADFIRSTVPLMGSGGSVINVTSSEAHQAAPGFAVYAAMKAAVSSLTRTLALELAEQKIRVNAIAPDALPTVADVELRDHMLSTEPRYVPVLTPPLGYRSTGEEAAAAAAFLAGDLASFITGVTIHVDGGIWAAGGWRLREGAFEAGDS